MKKKPQEIIKEFKMPHLFREDLEEIENLLKKLSPNRYILETQDFEYENVEEIPKDLIETNEFDITPNKPYISISFSLHDATLYTNKDDVKTIGTIEKIAQVILPRERKLIYWARHCVWITPLFVGYLTGMVLASNKSDLYTLWILPIISLFIIALCAIPLFNYIRKFSIVNFGYKKNKITFFSRNKDQIILILLTSFLSVIGTIFVIKFISQ